jgi:hypothetical protein
MNGAPNGRKDDRGVLLPIITRFDHRVQVDQDIVRWNRSSGRRVFSPMIMSCGDRHALHSIKFDHHVTRVELRKTQNTP